MKKINRFWLILLAFCSMSIFYSCESNDELAELISITTYEAEDIEDFSVTLCARIPLDYKDDFDFEISKESNMEKLVHYNVIKQISLPNSLDNSLIIKIEIDDLDPTTDYFYRIAVTNRLSNKKTYGDILSFKSKESTLKDVTIGKARYSDTGKIISGFNVNLLLNTGTASGEVEKHNILVVGTDRENKEKNITLPSIKVWKKEVTGKIFAYHLRYSDDIQSIYTEPGNSSYAHAPIVQESNNIIYFKEIDNYNNLYAGCSESFISDIILKPTMAEIRVTVTGCGENSLTPIYLCSNDMSKSVFYSGWIDLATGLWTKDEEGSKGQWTQMVAGFGDESGTIRKMKFFYPPSEFEEHEISLNCIGTRLNLPKTKWEAGHIYEYEIASKSLSQKLII